MESRPDAPHLDDALASEAGEETRAGVSRRRWTRYLPVAAVALGVVAVLASGATRYLSPDLINAKRAALLAFVHLHPAGAFLVYVGIYVVVVAFSLPGALVMTLTGGFLFGPVVGAAAAVAGAATGATIMFLVARSAFGEFLRRHARSARSAAIERGIRENSFWYLLALRLIPVPLGLVTIAASFVDMKLATFVLATVLGIIPPTLIYASFGANLGHLFDNGAAFSAKAVSRMIFQPQVLLPLIGLALLSLVPVCVHAWRARRRAVSRPDRLG